MVFPYSLDNARRVAIVTFSGTVRGHDIADTMDMLYRDPAWQYGFDTLWDGTNVTELLFEKDDLPGFVALQQRYVTVSGPGRDIVVAIRPIDQMIAQIYVAMSKKLIRHGYACRSASEAWEILRRARDYS